MDDVPIRDESIRLGQFLKLANLIDTGSDAKELMIQGLVTVNGEVETRRGRQLVPGDVVTLGGARRRAGSPAGIWRRDPGSRASGLSATSTRSTTKISVSPGLITPPAPRSPYARWGGMTSRRRPPTFMPCTPWSQPEMTWPTPRRKSSGAPRLYDASNSSPGRVGHADVVHRHGAAGGGLRAVALGQLDDLEVSGRRAVGRIDLGLLCTHGLHPATTADRAATGG